VRATSDAPSLLRLLVLVLVFFALTIPLAWLWLEWGQDFYTRFIAALLGPIYEILGIQRAKRGPVEPRLVSLVPFLVLMAITPSIGWQRRVWGSVFGIGALVAFHLVLLTAVDAAYARHGAGTRAVATFFPVLLINDGLPFLVWLVVARDLLRDIVPGLGEAAAAAQQGQEPAGGEEDR
jgi:hypothetical protein